MMLSTSSIRKQLSAIYPSSRQDGGVGAGQQRGFSLIEIAVVLVILGFLLGTLLGPLASQQANRRIKDTENRLQEIHDALLGYAAINGFLPCPASNASNGLEVRTAGPGSNCSVEHGYVPSATLGLTGNFDSQRRIVDAWSWPIRYSLSSVNTWEYAKNITVNSGPAAYSVCDAAGCAGNVLAANVVAVIYSLGPNGDTTPASADQLENLDADNAFAFHPPIDQAGAEFDDLVVWLSPAILTLHLVKSGQFN